MPFCFAPYYRFCITESAVAASIHLYEVGRDL